jgi:hypothetical protein
MKTAIQIFAQYRNSFWANPEHYGRTGIAAYQWQSAKREADIRVQWADAEDKGLVRLRVEPDEHCDLGDLFGDTFDPRVNTGIKPERLEREKQAEIDRINRDGVWGIIGEYRCPTCGKWTQADSCWGFVGDDWRESGYDLDIMATALERIRLNTVR